jgi:OOP family OmpA-OmpF porin
MTRNKNVLLATVFATAIVAISSAAMAQGFYWGGSIGKSKAYGCTGVTISCNDTSAAWKIFGGYQVNRNFAAELGYTDLGKTKARGVVSGVNIDAKTEKTAWELVGIGSIPVADRFSLYGKLGINNGKVKDSATGSAGGFTATAPASAIHKGPTFGFGAELGITQNIAVRAEWQRYKDMGGTNTGKSNVDVLGVGLLYRFQ